MTEDDIARITERERRETRDERNEESNGSNTPEGVTGGGGPNNNAIAPDDPLAQQPGRHNETPMENGSPSSDGSDSSAATPSSTSALLMGVPVAKGQNATKFVYVEVPEDTNKEGHEKHENEHGGSSQFDVEEEASRLCGGLHDKDNEGEEFSACLSSLTVALSSR